jgi:hypothetical protein
MKEFLLAKSKATVKYYVIHSVLAENGKQGTQTASGSPQGALRNEARSRKLEIFWNCMVLGSY